MTKEELDLQRQELINYELNIINNKLSKSLDKKILFCFKFKLQNSKCRYSIWTASSDSMQLIFQNNNFEQLRKDFKKYLNAIKITFKL